MQSLTCSETMIQYLLPFLVLISCTCKVIHHRENPIITPCRDGHIKGKKTSRFFMHAVQILIYLQKREAYLSLKRNIKNLHVKAMGIKKAQFQSIFTLFWGYMGQLCQTLHITKPQSFSFKHYPDWSTTLESLLVSRGSLGISVVKKTLSQVAGYFTAHDIL